MALTHRYTYVGSMLLAAAIAAVMLAGCRRDIHRRYHVSTIDASMPDTIRFGASAHAGASPSDMISASGGPVRSGNGAFSRAPSGSAFGGSGKFRTEDVLPGGRAGSHYGQDGKLRGPDSDYIDKSDVYWKLNWIRKRLLYGPLPADLADDIAKSRKAANEIQQHDSNYAYADEAVTHLEAGLKHMRAEQALEAAYTNRFNIPWAAGKEAVQHYIDQGGLGFGRKSSQASPESYHPDDDENPSAPRLSMDLPLSSAQKKAIAVVLEYAGQYRESPEQEMRHEWQQAIVATNKLRDGLGLMRRKDNDDGDETDVASGVINSVVGSGGTPSSDSAAGGASMPQAPANPFDQADRNSNGSQP